jgi:UDP-3-O-[3-hydroxymyristoyl] glucosamine N-acyltransferase
VFLTVAQIAKHVGGSVEGDPATPITGVSGIKEAKPGDLTFIANKRYSHLIDQTQASAVVVDGEFNNLPVALMQVEAVIRVTNPDLAFAQAVELFAPPVCRPVSGISEQAFITPGTQFGADVAVSPFVYIDGGTSIGDGSILYPHVFVGRDVRIGRNCVIYPNVVIRERSVIGNNVIIHAGTVVGSDGFGYSTVDGVQVKIPQIGIVVIEDDVEIGSNVSIDRARFDRTVIGKGTKIDNLVQIAHNVHIGRNSVIISQCAIAGSARIGNNVILAGQCAIDGHIEIGDGARIAAKAGVTKNVPPESQVSGFPAQPHGEQLREQAVMRKLPELLREMRRLEERLASLESSAANDRQEDEG